jgi:hypothetical protein
MFDIVWKQTDMCLAYKIIVEHYTYTIDPRFINIPFQV